MAANQYSNPNHNSQGPEGTYDPAGSTQMFRAFVEEAEPARAAAPGSRRQPKPAGSKTGVWLGLALGLVLLIGAVAWLALR
ncbi:hypothetical protein ABZ128_02130 [Streptomyces sp. NPDC006326]|uniref:hypothetical protein n=1 Tax=Streptomyces sp. NPDC006326 TaxID=3156752 RepID=UPI0033AE9286